MFSITMTWNNDMPKSTAPSESEIRGRAVKIEQDGSAQHRNGILDRGNDGGAQVAEKKSEPGTPAPSSREIFQNRVKGSMD